MVDHVELDNYFAQTLQAIVYHRLYFSEGFVSDAIDLIADNLTLPDLMGVFMGEYKELFPLYLLLDL